MKIYSRFPIKRNRVIPSQPSLQRSTPKTSESGCMLHSKGTKAQKGGGGASREEQICTTSVKSNPTEAKGMQKVAVTGSGVMAERDEIILVRR